MVELSLDLYSKAEPVTKITDVLVLYCLWTVMEGLTTDLFLTSETVISVGY